MVHIDEQQDKPNCLFQAHVWFSNHSHQCGCFATIAAARRWAGRLHDRIIAIDTVKAMRRTGRF